jgi:hypothetical protein
LTPRTGAAHSDAARRPLLSRCPSRQAREQGGLVGLLPLNGAQDRVALPLKPGLKACGTARIFDRLADTNATLRASLSSLAIITGAVATARREAFREFGAILVLAALNLSELGYDAIGAAMYVDRRSRG